MMIMVFYTVKFLPYDFRFLVDRQTQILGKDNFGKFFLIIAMMPFKKYGDSLIRSAGQIPERFGSLPEKREMLFQVQGYDNLDD